MHNFALSAYVLVTLIFSLPRESCSYTHSIVDFLKIPTREQITALRPFKLDNFIGCKKDESKKCLNILFSSGAGSAYIVISLLLAKSSFNKKWVFSEATVSHSEEDSGVSLEVNREAILSLLRKLDKKNTGIISAALDEKKRVIFKDNQWFERDLEATRVIEKPLVFP